MSHETSTLAIAIFFAFVAFTIGLSFYLGRKAKSSEGYFAAHGQIPWFINGVAFAGDYLSAASFLGICGMIAFYGYDGFLYSIGYLAGWIVALFIVAEPMKRLGKFTFADALDAKFNSRGIKLAAGVSTLAVSVFYLIPQMVGAGALVQPLLGLEHWQGVVIVGVTVILIVVTAGMVSTTWVQFIKGSLLVVFSAVLTMMLLARGFETRSGGIDDYEFRTLGPVAAGDFEANIGQLPGIESVTLLKAEGDTDETLPTVKTEDAGGATTFWSLHETDDGQLNLREAQSITTTAAGGTQINGRPKGEEGAALHYVGYMSKLPEGKEGKSGKLGLLSFFSTMQESEVVLWGNKTIKQNDGSTTKLYFQKPTPGSQVLRPGEHPKFKGIRGDVFIDKLNFLSLMLALFCGTASLPHILIRYYTVKDGAAARKSTIVGIATIGFFYILTLYIGLGAMTSGGLDVTDTNMAAAR